MSSHVEHDTCEQLGSDTGEQEESNFDAMRVSLRMPIRKVDCGNCHTHAVDLNGNVWATGWNYCGQLGIANRNYVKMVRQFVRVPGIDNVQLLACGHNYTMVVRGDGLLLGTGRNDCGQLGLGHTKDVSRFEVVGNFIYIRDISCGQSHTMVVLGSRLLLGTGSNDWGQLGVPPSPDAPKQMGEFHMHDVKKFKVVPDINNVQKVFCGGFHTMALCGYEGLFATGCNLDGQLGLGHFDTLVNSFKVVPILMLMNFVPSSFVEDMLVDTWKSKNNNFPGNAS